MTPVDTCLYYLAYMQKVTRENWRERAKAASLNNQAIAKATSTSHRSVTAYAQGTRRPTDEWIADVARLIGCIERGRGDGMGDR